MVKLKAILISDIHFSLSNLELASTALTKALEQADQNRVPLIIAGDLTDGKATIRGEVANRIISILQDAKTPPYILVGNHDKINEKGLEHALNYLAPYSSLVPGPVTDIGLGMIPYCSTNDAFLEAVNQFPKDQVLIVHQGVRGAYMGDYFKDDSSVDVNHLAGRRIISGHYHRKQDISLPEGGLWSYLGSPYSISYGEANDGPKGFCELYSDGALVQVQLPLRKHIIIERDLKDVLEPILGITNHDLLWLKVKGPYSELEKLDKKAIGLAHLKHANFKLDKVYLDAAPKDLEKLNDLTDLEVLDSLISNLEESVIIKTELSKLWRELLHETT